MNCLKRICIIVRRSTTETNKIKTDSSHIDMEYRREGCDSYPIFLCALNLKMLINYWNMSEFLFRQFFLLFIVFCFLFFVFHLKLVPFSILFPLCNWIDLDHEADIFIWILINQLLFIVCALSRSTGTAETRLISLFASTEDTLVCLLVFFFFLSYAYAMMNIFIITILRFERIKLELSIAQIRWATTKNAINLLELWLQSNKMIRLNWEFPCIFLGNFFQITLNFEV